MCPKSVCGILCGQKQSLTGLIRRGFAVFSHPAFLLDEQHENRAEPPRAVGCNQRVWAVRNSSVDISTTMWYSLTVEISTKAFVREERSHAGAI